MKLSPIQAIYDRNYDIPVDEQSYIDLMTNDDFLMVSPQVYYLLKQNGRLERTPISFQGRLKEKFSGSLVQNFFIKTQSEQVLRLFEEKRIDVIPIKGTGFSEKVFGHLAARPTSDIDLLIQRSDLERAIECVMLSGFSIEEESIPEHFHCSFRKELPGSTNPLRIELHWNIIREDTAAFDIQEFWQDAIPRPSFEHVKELSTYHTFYMICLHGWRHNLQSLKYYIDIIQMIDVMRDELDYTRLLKDAARHKTTKRIIRTLSIVYDEFPFLEAWVPFPYKRKIRHFDNKYVNYIDYQFLSFDSVGHSIKEFVYWMRYEVLNSK